MSRIAEIQRDEIEMELAMLKDIVARPQQSVTGMEFKFLLDNSDVIGENFESIITGLENVVPYVGSDYDEASQRMVLFVNMIRVAPIEVFMSYGDRIIALYDEIDKFSRFWKMKKFIMRLTFIGPEALPFIFRAQKLSYRDKFFAFCRVGASGRSITEPVLLEMWEEIMSHPGTGASIQPIIIAMKRIGMPVPTVPDDHVHKERIVVAKERFSDISTQSPVEMCELNWHRRRR